MEKMTQHEAIQASLQQRPPEEGAYLSGWVIVCEWASPGGGMWLTTRASEGVTPWKHRGMLYEAMDMDPEDSDA